MYNQYSRMKFVTNQRKSGTTRFDDPLTISSGTLTTLVYLKASSRICSNPSLDLFRGRGHSFFLQASPLLPLIYNFRQEIVTRDLSRRSQPNQIKWQRWDIQRKGFGIMCKALLPQKSGQLASFLPVFESSLTWRGLEAQAMASMLLSVYNSSSVKLKQAQALALGAQLGERN